ncbi:unnamed protein product [Rangifer tarandus platyrhynchus]|uniref:Uncharacterized protein n=1 Tax=Rangifer tarandus platyrhynchus TaxID=3082113 RepID=A0ABN8ZZY7_RANTA|nr:unnamed protein product [Rangifer tarandus platyrhynchus]
MAFLWQTDLHFSFCTCPNRLKFSNLPYVLPNILTEYIKQQVRFQPCPTLCSPKDCSPPGSSVHGISQPRILERVAIFFSRGSSRPRVQVRVSCGSCIDRHLLVVTMLKPPLFSGPQTSQVSKSPYLGSYNSLSQKCLLL